MSKFFTSWCSCVGLGADCACIPPARLAQDAAAARLGRGYPITRGRNTMRKLPSGDTLIAALRRKYRTPQAVLRKLGLDENLLEKETAEMPRLSRDQDDPDNDNMDGAALAQAVARTLIDMDPREGEIFAEAMQELLNSGDPLQWAEGILDNTANGATDRHRRARDTRRRPANDSAAADKSFARRFPGAARIDVSGGGLQEREREAEQRRKAAQRGGPSPLFNRLTSRVS